LAVKSTPIMSQFYKPESLMMSYGYQPEWSEGSIKCPIFQTSTFVFKTAEEGKAFFEVAYGKRQQEPNEKLGLIYSRINNPDIEILENRLCLWDKADDCAVFESGMAAIATVLLEFLKPGNLVLYSNPLYGGTDHFIQNFLPSIGVHTLGFNPWESKEDILKKLKESGHAESLSLVFMETPANPTSDLINIGMCREIADAFKTDDKEVIVAVDNTYMGPLWQHPLEHGADLIIYSATKYIGGHSDLIAGAVLGSKALMSRIKVLRTFLGNMAAPYTAWLLMRSLETLKVRMEQQQKNAIDVAEFLNSHDKISNINYLGLMDESHPQFATYQEQYEGPGAMMSFEVKGGEKEAFALLNALRLIRLAVSLGSTESLAEHPRSMTHAGVDEDQLDRMGVSHSLVRLSVGVENSADLIHDLSQALDAVPVV